MGIYSSIYYTLISKNVNKKHLWESKKVVLHRHHIVPRHSGGLDEESNYTYLTIREHICAHFLLWKIHRNKNDLRAMHMLGAKLTPHQRRMTGKFCFENNIGMFSDEYKNKRSEWGRKGAMSQIKNGKCIHTKDLNQRAQWAALGGKAGARSQMKNGIGMHTKDLKQRSEWASLGGKAHTGKKCMYKPGDKTFKRVKPKDIDKHLDEGYIFGSPFKKTKQLSS
jgi:hypothetical protein